MMEGAAGAGQPLPPRRTGHRLGGPSGLPPLREASAVVRAGDRAAGSGAGSEPPSMDFSHRGFVFLWIRLGEADPSRWHLPPSPAKKLRQWRRVNAFSRDFGAGGGDAASA
ncbi:hypothetical protein ZWY2020_008557 [Hordeum vulgare]|nr:hypothetical protein ZWY2020_008557 [Hordeum vulgare]